MDGRRPWPHHETFRVERLKEQLMAARRHMPLNLATVRLVSLLAVCVLAGTVPSTAAEPRSIFDGRSLAGWSGATDRWRV